MIGNLGKRVRAALILAPLAALAVHSPAEAQIYLGKVCLTVTVTERESGPVSPEIFTVQYDATNLGGSHYAVSGQLLATDEPMAAVGLGIIMNGELYINLATSQVHANMWMDTGINNTRLNLTTLAGTFYEIGRDFDRTNRTFNARYTAGTVAMTSCP